MENTMEKKNENTTNGYMPRNWITLEEEMNKFLETAVFKLNQEETDNLNRSTTSIKTESANQAKNKKSRRTE